ncbi:MAG: ABC transporter ATP-binding protein [Planctomycetaceae bacterium]|nr:ABC transporter ATP-binding protein [Planctomycetaceae bacterium]
MSDNRVIQIENLKKTFREGIFRRRQVHALNGVSFDVPRGSIFGLLGPNGAGKTTLIKILLGIVRRSEGDASVLGYRAGHRRAREHIGYLPENHRIPRHLTGNSALEYYGCLSNMSVKEVKQRRGGLLKTVGLEEWGDTSVSNYSKGMLQRLGLAQAMLHEPDLIILDEPTDGVDPVGRAEIRAVLKGLQQRGTTIFLNSHLLQEVELTCDRVAVLAKGQVRAVADVTELTKAGNDVRMRLAGAPEDILQTLQNVGITEPRIHAAPEGIVDVRFSTTCQDQVNQIVDTLRSQSVSILSLEPNRNSLEEAFLALVRESANS